MPTIVGILTFMIRMNFVFSWVEHEKRFYNLGARIPRVEAHFIAELTKWSVYPLSNICDCVQIWKGCVPTAVSFPRLSTNRPGDVPTDAPHRETDIEKRIHHYDVVIDTRHSTDQHHSPANTYSSKVNNIERQISRYIAAKFKTAYPEPYPLQKRSLSAKNKLSDRQWHENQTTTRSLIMQFLHNAAATSTDDYTRRKTNFFEQFGLFSQLFFFFLYFVKNLRGKWLICISQTELYVILSINVMQKKIIWLGIPFVFG